jgi:hypothetical protein
MRYAKFVGALFAAVFAIALAAATPALANDPEWVMCELTATGKLNAECGKGSTGKFEEVFLGEGQSKEIKAEENGAQVFKVAFKVECAKMKFKAGALAIGSKLPKAGTSKQSIIYSGCKIEGFANCKIDGEDPGGFTTPPLKATLDFKTKVAAEKLDPASAVWLLEPEAGATFAEVELTEEKPKSKECPKEGKVLVEGGVAFEVRLANSFALVHELTAPNPAIKPVWLWVKAGEVKEIPVKLTFGGEEAIYIGKSKLSFAGELFWQIEAL